MPSAPAGPTAGDAARERVGAIVMRCQSEALRVEPGSSVEASIEVGSTGTVVDEILLALTGPAAGLGTVTPDAVNLLPGATGTVVVAFAAPQGPGVRAGVHPWTLQATSREHAGVTSRIQGTLEVGRFVSGTAELEPTQTSGAGRTFEHTARLTNDGNCPWSVTIEPSGPPALDFEAGLGPVTVEPGQSTDAHVAVRTGRRWIGAPQSLPLEVRVAPASPDAPGPWPLVASRLQQPVLPAWLLTALMALAGLAIAAFAVFGRGSEPAAAVPAVAGRSEAAAEAALQSAGFTVTVSAEPDQKVSKGLAIRTDPPGGQSIPEGSNVTLFVSTGPATTPFPVPSVVGLTEEQARQLLTDKGFKVRVSQQPGEEPTGTAIRTDPATGIELPPGETVTLIVSSGPSPSAVAVPRVEGLTKEQATTRLKDKGFEVEVVTESSETAPSGQAINTDPPAGTDLNTGETITLIVSSGPKSTTVPVPPVNDLTEQQATELLNEKGFQVTVVTQTSDTTPAGQAITTDPPDGTQLTTGKTVTLIVSSGPPAAAPSGFISQPSFGGDCSQREPGTICVGFDDGYIWLVQDSILGWRSETIDGQPAQVAIGGLAEYQHLLGTDLIRQVPN